MRVAPAPEPLRAPHVLVADIEPADPGLLAVDHDDLAVVAILDAGRAEEAQEPVAVVEAVDADARLAQPLLVARGSQKQPTSS